LTKDNKFPTSIWVLLILFVLANIADIVSTFYVLPAEANPIYLLTGTVWSLVAAKLIACGVFAYIIWKKEFKTETGFFIFISVLAFVTIIMFSAAGRNLYHGLDTEENYVSPSTGEAVTYVEYTGEVTSPKERIQWYGIISVMYYFVPLIFLLIVFETYNRTKRHFTFDKLQPPGKVKEE